VIVMSRIDEMLRSQLRSDEGSTDEETVWVEVGRQLEGRKNARRKRRVGAVLCATLVVILLAGAGIYLAGSTTSSGSGSHGTKAIDPVLGPGGFTVTPDTDLVNHQYVTISIHGLEPESTIWIVMCVGHPNSVEEAETQCINPAPAKSDMVDLNRRGAARLRFPVERYLSPGGYQVDCATYPSGCSLGIGDPLTFGSGRVTGNIQAVTFKDTLPPPTNPRQISVTPTAPFSDGQTVTLTGTGFPPSSPVRAGECPTNADCGSYFATVETSPEGAFSLSLTLHRTYTVEQGTVGGGEQPVTIDCSQPLRCFVMAEEVVPPYSAASSIPLTFLPAG
jgi:hypothetical protein